MKFSDFIEIYQNDPYVHTLATYCKKQGTSIQVKGSVGSLDAVLATVLSKTNQTTQFIIAESKEQAYYIYTDLLNMKSEGEILLFPSSYKKPYQYEDIENANILQRAEVLNKLSGDQLTQYIIVSYPEALGEKVINKKSLASNTFSAKIGERIDTDFMAELLANYNFEKNDFVYEPGQYALRGGIVDIFSYANEYPYRLELFGDEIESIRTFDPDTQLSLEHKKFISIVPNVQTKLLQETRESFFNFLPEHSTIWIENIELSLQAIEKNFNKASSEFHKILEQNNGSALVYEPDYLFETKSGFEKAMGDFSRVYLSPTHLSHDHVLEFKSSPQPSFNKDFNLIAKDLHENQIKGYRNFIFAESGSQHDKLVTIFDEINPEVKTFYVGLALREGYIDHMLKIVCYTDHQLFERFHNYKNKERASKNKAITLKELKTLQPGDYVVHQDYGIARFVGLERVMLSSNKEQEGIRLVFRDDDLMVVSIHSLHKISKYSGKDGTTPTMSKLGSPEWENKKKTAKKKVKDIAKELISLYAKRKTAPGYAFNRDSFLQAELETSFLYEDTPDQAKATIDVKEDMEKPHPMDRLVCGDVGFGKTEVAIRAAFKAVCDGKQVAVLVPTTVLALQHFKTFKERLEKFPVKTEYVNRFRTAGQIKETLQRIKEGKTDILIGTQRILSKDVEFKDLGLLIIDEEQKFGVSTKEKLKQFKFNVDTLTLTATPIPRTLHFSLMGARDLSVIATPPPNRQPVTTEIHVFDKAVIRDAVSNELKRGGQVFFIHNKVSDLDAMADTIFKLVPDARIGIAHGQMDGEKLENVMLKFIDGEYDVLISTNIVESGLDIPNANTIIINNAQNFGLSDLHQMRGRVGRSNKKAYCYLIAPAQVLLSGDARKRLSTLEDFSELGDGFKVAMRDLDIRGAGNLLGAEQSGFITDLGFETYHQILDEAVQELKETEFKELFENQSSGFKPNLQDCVIETDASLIIPERYVNNISERLALYTELDKLNNGEQLQKFINSIIDRFGPVPEEFKELIETVRLRWMAEKIGFMKISLKNGTIRCYVNAQNDSFFTSPSFQNILKYVQEHPKKSRLKELKDQLMFIVDEIINIKEAISILQQL